MPSLFILFIFAYYIFAHTLIFQSVSIMDYICLDIFFIPFESFIT